MTDVRDQLWSTAQDVFAWPTLHPDQVRAMEFTMAGRDVLAVLPTGAGKSAIYQIPAVLRDGVAVVVSPLLALQRDQMDGIEASSAPQAVAINSSLRVAELRRAWRDLREGRAKYLFLSPEQLAKPEVLAELTALSVGLFVVDEAHCVSAWGHDFRPDYLRLAPVIEQLGHPPVIALTATAALPVRQDIVARLGLRAHEEVIASFDRPNLHLAVEPFVDDKHRRAALLSKVGALIADPTITCGLVYTASRKEAEAYADDLRAEGVRARAYHAGMKAADRAEVHEEFLADRLEVVVATSAFGMGIDKPDVRFVLHAAAPESIDSYYPQIGRAGRDEEPAEIVLFYRPEDLHLQTFLTAARPPEQALRKVAQTLADAEGAVSPAELRRAVDEPAARRTRAVNLLEQAGVVRTDATGGLEYDRGIAPRQASAAGVEVAEQHQQLIRSRIEMMRGYAETPGCRRQFLLGYFGEQLPHPCGNCDTCDAGLAEDDSVDDPQYPRNSAVRHPEWGHGVVMSTSADRLTVLFDEVGYKTLARDAVEANDLLEPA
ncbi:MAG: RecQ family ATP-dependent DNA helicase [Jatrophihabitans sp.]|uniref:RecQ family ATP-dependent DNA helicase n=1 Tax=Jatrophihabitans sp. TaxID=1932789 RepID=UPI003F7CFC76